ncbi:hypothetical protein LTR91_010963 [Friedmanniomyces endolithicus]|uniref:Uncharacterized protein n=1 Tax=Friedmanniomyces endolithicus TaxID=329885 RepID=A0AAN6QSF2_9PEZI|nr:hypothetical protein LTR94_006656 [Friedmanniomyces endolithicus]KAK0781792.1 hypothetical protein LTR59_012355 [Friedmanniomyces endolithicus]KAK0792682.1 hypothetical protein LTR75_011387 [Friedmanniomyces endolithicus]KAK0801816.1 hypothetical protein LTR38_006668 [Friedmanniomyces endolithicus]KAK0858673.1 hypothetical protein LTR03_000098 [Friedmanniomyces endolithicus]
MVFSCFRAGRGTSLAQQDWDEPARPRLTHNDRTKTKTTFLRRHGSADSRSSTYSNESISKLPPCSGVSDPQIEAMMMPVPPEAKASRCLRLSMPKTYSDIVDTMRSEKGCRDWRNFAVFYDDEVDMRKSAVECARRRAETFGRKARGLASFSSGDDGIVVATRTEQTRSLPQHSYPTPLQSPRYVPGEQTIAERLDAPYLHLLMPEPPPDDPEAAAKQAEDAAIFFDYLTIKHDIMDWRLTPVFPEDDVNMERLPRRRKIVCEESENVERSEEPEELEEPEEEEEEEEEQEYEYEQEDDDYSPASPSSVHSQPGPPHTRYRVVRSRTLEDGRV